MCGTVFPIFVHITAFPDIDRSAAVLYNFYKNLSLVEVYYIWLHLN